MKFWLTCVAGILVITGVMTAVYVFNPSNVVKEAAPTAEPGPQGSVTEIPDNAPKAKVDSTLAQFDNIGQFEAGSHTFHITNVGKSPLMLSPGKPSCTCTSAALDPLDGVVLPGKTATFTMSFNPKERVGKLGVRAPVGTNDPLKRNIDFQIHLDIKPELIVTRPEIFFGRVQEDKPIEETFQIYSTLHPTAKIELKSAPKSMQFVIKPLTDEQKKELKAKSGAEVVCRFNGKLPVGGFVEQAVFTTGLPKTKVTEVTLSGNVSGKIQLTPEYLNFVAVPLKGEKSRWLVISAAGLGDANSLSVGPITDAPFLQTKLTKDPKLAIVWRLDVTVPKSDPKKEPGTYSAVIPILDKNGVRRISIPVSVTVQSDEEDVSGQ